MNKLYDACKRFLEDDDTRERNLGGHDCGSLRVIDSQTTHSGALRSRPCSHLLATHSMSPWIFKMKDGGGQTAHFLKNCGADIVQILNPLLWLVDKASPKFSSVSVGYHLRTGAV